MLPFLPSYAPPLLSLPLSLLFQRLRLLSPLPTLPTSLLFTLLPCILLFLFSTYSHISFLITLLMLRISKRPVAVTANIACGKSTFVKGYLTSSTSLIDLDGIAHKILLPPTSSSSFLYTKFSSYTSIISTFGSSILNSDKTINRTTLGSIIFSNPSKRRLLNKLTHPNIRYIMLFKIILNTFKGKIVLVDIPLLYESKLGFMFSLIYVINLKPDEQLKRLINRNPELSEKECKQRIESQMNLDFKLRKADKVVDNNGPEYVMREWAKVEVERVKGREMIGWEIIWGGLGLLKFLGFI
ncbi:hypothetical protein TrLO_g5746 [Triparma laevis f. longispina]|uniref:Dephospho-CoA kinase n=1 Tax=Triparma laevis f. longispina TaxID=1714387 RepID=A0A9W7FGX1_9STRA|nr:hypothetical protein TrLO_g5746 [Triparma laevis f. longispina]